MRVFIVMLAEKVIDDEKTLKRFPTQQVFFSVMNSVVIFIIDLHVAHVNRSNCSGVLESARNMNKRSSTCSSFGSDKWFSFLFWLIVVQKTFQTSILLLYTTYVLVWLLIVANRSSRRHSAIHVMDFLLLKLHHPLSFKIFTDYSHHPIKNLLRFSW